MSTFALRDFDTGIAHDRRVLPGAHLDWLCDYREAALTEYRKQGLPGRKTEDWKYTSVRSLIQREFELDRTPDTTAPVSLPALSGVKHLAVMVNGGFSASLSRLDALPPGVTVLGLATTLIHHPRKLQDRIGAIATLDRHPFAALNGACFQDGLVIEVDSDVCLADPLVIVSLTDGSPPRIAQPRLWVELGEGAGMTLMQQAFGGPAGHLINQLTEVSVADSARLTQVVLQQPECDHLIHGTHVRCGRGSHYRALTFSLDCALLRNDLLVALNAPDAECNLAGLYLVGDRGHVDNHIRIDHRAPACHSRTLYKGLLGKGACGVFNGKVIVHPAGQKTDARQVNRNLLLSRDVEIDSKPELQIYADDVKCSHGSTTGELEADPLFYLRSRGIDLPQARALLAKAFVREISDGMMEVLVNGEALYDSVTAVVFDHLQQLVTTKVSP